MMRIVLAVLVGQLLFSCCPEEHVEHDVVVLPRTPMTAVGSPALMDLYLVQHIDSNDVQIRSDQEGVNVEFNGRGGLTLRKETSGSGPLDFSGTLTIAGHEEGLEYSGRTFAVHLKPSVKSYTMVRGRMNRIDISMPGIPEPDLMPTITNGRIVRENGHYYVIPGDGDSVSVYLRYPTFSGVMKTTEPVHFEVLEGH